MKFIKELILDTFFPKKCVNCGAEGKFLCSKCFEKIIFIKAPACLTCGKLTKKGNFCTKCRSKVDLTGIIIAAHFEEGPLKEMIHTFKYDGLKDLSKELSTYLAIALKEYNFNKKFVLTFMPLHRSRLIWRGYNQSELLATELSRDLGLEVKDLLIKTKKTKSQIGLKRKERLKNQIDAFQVNARKIDSIKDNIIVIVDDVVTTGASLNGCAKVLRKAGAKEVWGLVLGKH